jgi:hypothetical protein
MRELIHRRENPPKHISVEFLYILYFGEPNRFGEPIREGNSRQTINGLSQKFTKLKPVFVPPRYAL